MSVDKNSGFMGRKIFFHLKCRFPRTKQNYNYFYFHFCEYEPFPIFLRKNWPHVDYDLYPNYSILERYWKSKIFNFFLWNDLCKTEIFAQKNFIFFFVQLNTFLKFFIGSKLIAHIPVKCVLKRNSRNGKMKDRKNM